MQRLGFLFMNYDLKHLVEKWRLRAAAKFMDAKRENNVMGKRLIEHGATCYANAATELENIAFPQQTQSGPILDNSCFDRTH